MKEFLANIDDWSASSTRIAIATVIKTWGSSPRPVGSIMLISEHGEMAGSVSGGCVEGAVVKAAKRVINSGESELLEYGVTNDDAWVVGLSCGGQITVFVEPFLSEDSGKEEFDVWRELIECIENNVSCVLISQLNSQTGNHSLVLPDGSSSGKAPGHELKEAALHAFKHRKHVIFEDGEDQFFIQVFARRDQLLIIGAAHISADLVEFAHAFDFETIVIDPRGAFANKTQFSTQPDTILEKYPSEVIQNYTLDANTYAVILSHDPKIDDNALQFLLPSDVAYIGALGSKKTHAKRVERLRSSGFSDTQIDRIYAPIGVNIYAKTPREIALSIMAQIISVKRGGESQ